MSITHLSAETRPEGLLQHSPGNSFLRALFGSPPAGWSSPCVQPAQGREPRAASVPVGEPGHLHWAGSPLQGQVYSPLGPVASDLGDKPHHAPRSAPHFQHPKVRSCGHRSPRLPLCSLPLPVLLCGGNAQPALTQGPSAVPQLPPFPPLQDCKSFIFSPPPDSSLPPSSLHLISCRAAPRLQRAESL